MEISESETDKLNLSHSELSPLRDKKCIELKD